jgi:hypothetical protein
LLPLWLGCGRLEFEPLADGSGVTGVTVVQTASQWTPAMVATQSITLTPTAGNLLVLAISNSFDVPMSVVDNAGNTYVGVPSNPTANDPVYCNISVYYATNIAAVADQTIVVTSTSTDYVSLAVHEIAGADPQAPFVADLRTNGMSAMPTGGPIESDADGTLYFATLCHNQTRTTSFSPDYQVLEVPTEAGSMNSALVTAYKLGDAAVTTTSATLSSSDNWQVILAAFR